MLLSLRRSLRAVGALVTAVALAATLLSAAPAQARRHHHWHQTPWTPSTGPVFGNPNGTERQQYAVVNDLLRNINHAPRGSTITLVAYSFALERVTKSLTLAFRRGVRIRALIDSHSLSWPPARELGRLLNKKVGDASYVGFSHGSTRVPGGDLHQKTWLFSHVGRAHWVSMVGSTNLTNVCAEKEYSDMLTFANRRDIYDEFMKIYRIQVRQRSVMRPYRFETFRGGDAYFLPMRYWTPQRDPVVIRIQNIPARRATIKVAQFSWWGGRGAAIAKALAVKSRQGARITAILGPHVSVQVRRILRRAGVHLRRGYFTNGTHVHSKLMLASYVRRNGRIWKVWTGSDNWAPESIGHDEVEFGYRSKALWHSYIRFLDEIPVRRLR
ncbi:MAG: phospholipase D-like domain-containing protein [Actinomycetota bacterium]|nr:phospholipase D-like domain-containing protein [Actinomycetota bacterium]